MFDLVIRNLRRARHHLGSSLFGVVTGVAVLGFFLALGGGVRHVIQGEVFPIERLDVVPARGGIASLGVLAGRQSKATIDEQKASKVARIPGVQSVYPRMKLDFPAKAWGGEKLFGHTMWTEIVADGIPEHLVIEELGQDTLFRDWSGLDSGRRCKKDADCPDEEYCEKADKEGRCSHPVPFIVSRYLLELYNGSVVEAHDLPAIPDWVVEKGRGMRLNMDIGKSSLGKSTAGKPRKVAIVFAGVSDQAMDIGITVPIGYARRWNEEFAGAGSSHGYSSLTLLVEDRRDVTAVADRLKKMGLVVESKGAEQVGLMITIFESTFAVIAMLILLISAFNISHAFFLIAAERRREFGIMRAVGATRADILGSMLLEGTLIGVVGSAGGLIAAFVLSMIGNAIAASYLPDFPFKPDDFFHFSAGLVVSGFGLGTASCLVGVLLPAWMASREDPTRSLM